MHLAALKCETYCRFSWWSKPSAKTVSFRKEGTQLNQLLANEDKQYPSIYTWFSFMDEQIVYMDSLIEFAFIDLLISLHLLNVSHIIDLSD